jgi:hypothetical protein
MNKDDAKAKRQKVRVTVSLDLDTYLALKNMASEHSQSVSWCLWWLATYAGRERTLYPKDSAEQVILDFLREQLMGMVAQARKHVPRLAERLPHPKEFWGWPYSDP